MLDLNFGIGWDPSLVEWEVDLKFCAKPAGIIDQAHPGWADLVPCDL